MALLKAAFDEVPFPDGIAIVEPPIPLAGAGVGRPRCDVATGTDPTSTISAPTNSSRHEPKRLYCDIFFDLQRYLAIPRFILKKAYGAVSYYPPKLLDERGAHSGAIGPFCLLRLRHGGGRSGRRSPKGWRP